jgi:hypothetical protein
VQLTENFCAKTHAASGDHKGSQAFHTESDSHHLGSTKLTRLLSVVRLQTGSDGFASMLVCLCDNHQPCVPVS